MLLLRPRNETARRRGGKPLGIVSAGGRAMPCYRPAVCRKAPVPSHAHLHSSPITLTHHSTSAPAPVVTSAAPLPRRADPTPGSPDLVSRLQPGRQPPLASSAADDKATTDGTAPYRQQRLFTAPTSASSPEQEGRLYLVRHGPITIGAVAVLFQCVPPPRACNAVPNLVRCVPGPPQPLAYCPYSCSAWSPHITNCPCERCGPYSHSVKLSD